MKPSTYYNQRHHRWWVSSKNNGFSPESSILIGVFHDFHPPFWGKIPYFWFNTLVVHLRKQLRRTPLADFRTLTARLASSFWTLGSDHRPWEGVFSGWLGPWASQKTVGEKVRVPKSPGKFQGKTYRLVKYIVIIWTEWIGSQNMTVDGNQKSGD